MRLLLACVLSLSPFSLPALAADPAPANANAKAEDLQPIFNGKDLTGWKKPANPALWRVENGLLVGEQTDPKGKGGMLYTEQSYKDVVIECEVRFGHDIDSGIMVRKPEIQVQFGVSRSLKKDMTCSIYAHGKYPGVAQGTDKLLKLNEWNAVRFQAKGDTFDTWLNGRHVLTYKDDKFPNPGPIGLQIHGGVAMKVEFRNLRAKSLDAATARAN